MTETENSKPAPKKASPWLWGCLVVFIISLVTLGGCLAFCGSVAVQVDKEMNAPQKITLAKFNKIKSGMTYEEVVEILGEEGTVMSDSEMGGQTAVMYSWSNKNGSNMNAMFQNGGLINRSQFGIK